MFVQGIFPLFGFLVGPCQWFTELSKSPTWLWMDQSMQGTLHWFHFEANRILIWQRQLILTKGDNNAVDDVTLYPKGRSSVDRQEVVGLVIGYIPHLGRLILGLKESSELLYAVALMLVIAGMFL
jgi:hypothetical protein